RLLLEAKALDATGDGDKALALLSQSSLLAAIEQAADVYWRRKDWASAAALYRKAYAATDAADDRRSRRLLRSGVSYVAANDEDGLSALLELAQSDAARPEFLLLQKFQESGSLSEGFTTLYKQAFADDGVSRSQY
ncbi:MAG: hypothetical protein AAGJ87_17500, partial [Pseudomonadota bacterium]